MGQENALKYSEVIQVEGATKTLLFQRAKTWFTQNFINSRNSINIQELESGECSGKGVLETSFNYLIVPYRGPVQFEVSVITKDGKYKYEFSNFTHHLPYNILPGFGLITSSSTNPVKWKGVREEKMDQFYKTVKSQIALEIVPFTESLNKAMTRKVDADF